MFSFDDNDTSTSSSFSSWIETAIVSKTFYPNIFSWRLKNSVLINGRPSILQFGI